MEINHFRPNEAFSYDLFNESGVFPYSCSEMALARLIETVFDKKSNQTGWDITWKCSLNCDLRRKASTFITSQLAKVTTRKRKAYKKRMLWESTQTLGPIYGSM